VTFAKRKNASAYAGLTSNGRITIPKHARSALSLRTGDIVAWTIVEGRLIGTPRNLEFADLAGFLGDSTRGPATLEEIDIAVTDAAGLHAVDDKPHDAKKGVA